VVIVRYSRWRAIGAIALPLILLAVPVANWLLNPADFRARWIDEWVSTAGVALAVLWFVYALWPSAFRLLSGGTQQVRIKNHELVLDHSGRRNLLDLSGIEILRPWLQHPRIVLRFPSGLVMLETAYQTIGERRAVEDIANSVKEAARS
jgi:hypothetical protein